MKLNKNKPLFSHPCRVIIGGRSTTGKTTQVIKLFHSVFKFVDARRFLICPSYLLDPKWRTVDGDLRNDDKVFTEYNDYIINWLSREIKNRAENGLNSVLILDDITRAARTGGQSEKRLNRIIANAIWLKCTIIYSVQSMVHTTVDMRQNADYLIMFRTENNRELDSIYECFGVGSKKDFKKLMRVATDVPYSFLFVNRHGPETIYCKNFSKINFTLN